MNPKSAFSLVEVLVALVIIAIMGSVVAIALDGTTDEAKVTATNAELDTLASAITLFRAQQGFLPTQRQGLSVLVQAPTREPLAPRYPQGGYLQSSEVPLDAWDNSYIYLTPGRNGQPYEILSYGADGIEGGTGPNADLSTAD